MSEKEPVHPFAAAAARQRRAELIHEALAPLRKESGERNETGIFMALWQDLGDQTETYWQAMTAVTAFVEIERMIHEKLSAHELNVSLRVAEALVATLQARIHDNRAFEAKRDEIIKANPLPGDNS
jgi:hypothetical protein